MPSILMRALLMREPSMRSFIRLKQRSRVDLPQPDGPMNAVTARAGMSQRHTVKDLCGRRSEIEVGGSSIITRLLRPASLPVREGMRWRFVRGSWRLAGP